MARKNSSNLTLIRSRRRQFFRSRTMEADRIQFPVFEIHTDNVEEIDGILWIDDQVLDDKNMSGETLGARRLETPMKSIYPLRYMIDDIIGVLKHRGKNFIDSNGYVFTYEKTDTLQIKYHKILRKVKKGVCAVVWLKDCPFAFTEKSPPPPEVTWAGVLYRNDIPWKIYNYSDKKEKDTWRKV